MTEYQPGVTVIVPTYKRTADLDRCLAAIDTQTLKAVEVLITYRADDEETQGYLARTARPAAGARLLLCEEPGVVYALNKAFDAVRTEFFAITDDDAVPNADWLARIVAHFESDPSAAAVGGKDYVYADGRWMEGAETEVGRVLWFGLLIGHHHVGAGPARYVESLKGVNLAFRTSAFGALRLDTRLRGKGAQVGWEMQLTLSLIVQGHKIIYDPQVLVKHFCGWRPIEEDRTHFNPISHGDEVYNRTLILMEYLGSQRWGWLRRAMLLTYMGLRGSRRAPGLLLLAAGLVTRYPNSWVRFKTTTAACRDAVAAARPRLEVR
jgi:GT2 family glycosyltransferase